MVASVLGPGPGTKQERFTAASKVKGTPNPLTPAARMEHALVGQSLMEVIGPRLQGEVCLFITFSAHIVYCLYNRFCHIMFVLHESAYRKYFRI